MECDLATLKRLLYVHNIDVLGYDVESNTIACNTLFSDGDRVVEYAPATLQAVRDYLGY